MSFPLQADNRPLITVTGWVWIVVLGALFATCHYNFLWRMIHIAWRDPDWQHALIVPLIGVYFIFQNRTKLIATRQTVEPVGLILVFLGMCSYAWWIYPGRNDMFQGYSMILALFGLVWFLLGHRMLKYLWFPIAYLVFAIKISPRLWDRIAWMLQDIAASVSATVLKLTGPLLNLEVQISGNTIEMWNEGVKVEPSLTVAEACSGLRMLMAFVALGVAMAFLSNRAWWQRLTMVLMAVPIAVIVNVGRVVIVGVVYAKVNSSLRQDILGDFHIFIGMLMLIPAAGLFMLLGWILENIVIDDVSQTEAVSIPTGGVSVPEPLGDSEFSAVETEPGVSLVTKVRMGLLGLLAGLVLAAGAGFAYGMTIISFRPGRFFEWLSRPMALTILAVVVVVLTVTVWCIRPMLASFRVSGSTIAAGMGGGVLLVAIIGLNGVVAATETVLFKEEIPLRHRLTKLPRNSVGKPAQPYGVWRCDTQDIQMPADQEKALGTKHYIRRRYVDTMMPEGQPESVVRLHVAYYTGTIDTVPHVPDRCLLAGGARAVGSGIHSQSIQVSGASFEPSTTGDYLIARGQLNHNGTYIPSSKIRANVFTYTLTPTAYPANVLYFFAANGKFLRTPEEVRALAFDPRDRYSYFCKIEVGLPLISDATIAAERAAAFLSVMLPEIMACLPDWVEVERGEYPPSALGES